MGAAKGKSWAFLGTPTIEYAFIQPIKNFFLMQLINNEELKQGDDVEKLTEERLNKILQMFLNDFKADKVEAHRWPKDFSAYKVTLNAYTRIMASRHPELRINCAHPGCVKTDMTIRSGLLTPEEGASNLVKVALLRAYFDLGHKAPFM
jgi:(+)-neomenthol dehydrogenase